MAYQTEGFVMRSAHDPAPARGGRIEDLDTPAVVIDLDVVEHNIAKLQAYCDSHGLQCRPHIKTHKLPVLAHKQVEAGAVGITTQKIGEAEVMAEAGIDDILITYNLIGSAKAERLAALTRLAKIRVAVDNEVALDTIIEAGAHAVSPIGVLVEFESGKQRQGVLEPQAALTLARKADEADNIEFLGLLTYPSTPASAEWIARARALFSANDLAVTVVSGGGTPNAWRSHEIEGLTEYRAGTYIYHDRKSVGVGVATLDECALHVHATVVSMPTSRRGVIDAGSKTLTSDAISDEFGRGYGLILEYPEAVITELSEEHGLVDFSACERRPAIGERVRVLPNHVCPVTNLHDEVYAHRGGIFEAAIPVAARGKTR
ncbi:MAG: D-TA family PLP-dependent enzyme [Trueperaceae bacterium]